MNTQKIGLLILLLLPIVSCADYNSSTLDDLEYLEVTTVDSDPNFAQAFDIIKRRCAYCHEKPSHQKLASYNTNDKWIESGWISRHDPANSSLITRTTKYNPSDIMPPKGDLTKDEYLHLLKWINEMP